MASSLESVQNTIFSVTEVTLKIKKLVSERFNSLWIRGEISNFKHHPSGHFYFVLKDDRAVMPAAMFKGSQRALKFRPEDGMRVVVRGRIDVYEVQGRYQFYVDTMEPDGVGALQIAFEQLKKKLKAEGLFDESRKRKLPYLPGAIGLVTSESGAAVQDMISVLKRRFPAVNIMLYPAKVQGEGAAVEIASGINYFSVCGKVDVIIVGRGGGSIEDLWAFNEEIVARAVVQSRIPVISAVGHETDFTICDFVADLRAPTPSAAAELCVPSVRDLMLRVNDLKSNCLATIIRILRHHEKHIAQLRRLLPKPDALWQRTMEKLGELEDALHQAMKIFLRDKKIYLSELRMKIISPRLEIQGYLSQIQIYKRDLQVFIQRLLATKIHHVDRLQIKLDLLSPRNVLKRGYVISRRSDGTVVSRKDRLQVSEELTLTFFDGDVPVSVKG